MTATLNAQAKNTLAYITKEVNGTYEEVFDKLEERLKAESFGIITEINMQEKLKDKLENIDVDTYKIFGVCNPAIAYEAIKVEPNIGVFLPCKIIIRKTSDKSYSVASFNPSLMMSTLGNSKLDSIAQVVTEKIRSIITNL